MIESLKPFSELHSQDERQNYRGLSLEAVHEFAAALTLNAGVPERVQDQFTIARHAVVYSWFVYPMNSAAELYGLLAVEQALYLRALADDPTLAQRKTPPTLAPLLKRAIQKRWLLDVGFSKVPEDPYLWPEARARFGVIPDDQRYCYSLLEDLPRDRNHLAHGTYVLAPGPRPHLRRDADLINQLFPTSADSSV
jgi:hypothetical protein